MCGADRTACTYDLYVSGSPPRVRSRLSASMFSGRGMGITSACAEQTAAFEIIAFQSRDHLCVCGADHDGTEPFGGGWGSPPRVRSRHGDVGASHGQDGITSACAEQTYAAAVEQPPIQDHLRVCGADNRGNLATVGIQGSPPRVRSRRWSGDRWKSARGITSACAEQTVGRCICTRSE